MLLFLLIINIIIASLSITLITEIHTSRQSKPATGREKNRKNTRRNKI